VLKDVLEVIDDMSRKVAIGFDNGSGMKWQTPSVPTSFLALRKKTCLIL